MAGPTEPKKRRSAPIPAEVAARLEQNKTVDLDTADLDELAQEGVVVTKTRHGVPRLGPDLLGGEPSIVVDDTAPPPAPVAPAVPVSVPPPGYGVEVDPALTVAELPSEHLGAAVAQREVKTQYVRRVSATRAAIDPTAAKTRGIWIVILVYVVAAGALILSIYARVTS